MRTRMLAVSLLTAVSVFGLPEWNAAAATTFQVTAQGMSAYLIDGASNPTLTLTRGQTYTFNVNVSVGMPHPFWITTARGAGDVSANAYGPGVSNNGASPGLVTFTVPSSAPATLFYQCAFHDPMAGTLNIVSPAVTTAAPAPSVTGPGAATLAGLLLLIAVACLGISKRRAAT